MDNALDPEKNWLADTCASYDTVAADYADLVRGLLDRTPYERAMLALFAESVRAAGGGPVWGAGPGGSPRICTGSVWTSWASTCPPR